MGTPKSDHEGCRATERIIEDIAQHLLNYPPVKSVDEILRRFLDEMKAVS